ncbi:hypothetical protein MLPF_0352 [Mycobacterium lepromatosis]|nr:hypothetical protein MLPF_0352 [Mycobacterium lepromatosis]
MIIGSGDVDAHGAIIHKVLAAVDFRARSGDLQTGPLPRSKCTNLR